MKNHSLIQEAFFALVRAGLFPVHGERVVVLGQAKRQSRANDSFPKGVDWGDVESTDLRNHGFTEPVDWEKVYQLAAEQSVQGLVLQGLEWYKEDRPECVSNLSLDLLLQWIGEVQMIEQQNRAMNQFIAKLIETLRKEDVYAILVKGQGIAQCYEKPLWRSSGDIDLLLDAENYEKAKNLLIPLATDIETEYTYFKHLGMTINEWVIELHGTFQSRLSKRIDKEIDMIQGALVSGVRFLDYEDKQIAELPDQDSDVIFVFTHILHHYFFEGIGLRQICDWCRLLWTYRGSLDLGLLESRIRKMGLMTEWKSFAAYAVEWLGMPVEAMPLYSDDDKWKRKATRINAFVLSVGNFGHKQRRNFDGQPYLVRKFVSSWGRLNDMLRHFMIFPKDSIVFFGGVLRSGLYAAVRGE